MQVHLCIPEIRAEDFDIWLGLFDQAAQDVLGGTKQRRFPLSPIVLAAVWRWASLRRALMGRRA